MRKIQQPTRDWLHRKYIVEKLSAVQIAKLCGCSYSPVYRWLRTYEIPIRDNSEAQKAIWITSPLSWGKEYRKKNSERMKQEWATGKRTRTFSIQELVEMAERTSAAWKRGTYDKRETDACHTARSAAMKRRWKRGDFGKEWRERQSIRVKEEWAKTDIHRLYIRRGRTNIEHEIALALDGLGICHVSQYSPKGTRRIFDEFILPNILVEIHGDYWHAFPGLYSTLDRIQERNVRRDAEKRSWAIENGYSLVVIWQHEIEHIGAEKIVRERLQDVPTLGHTRRT